MITESSDVPIATLMGGLRAVSPSSTGQTELPFHLPGWSFRLEPARKRQFGDPVCPPPAAGHLWANIISFLSLNLLIHQRRDWDCTFDKVLFFDSGVLCPLLSKRHEPGHFQNLSMDILEHHLILLKSYILL